MANKDWTDSLNALQQVMPAVIAGEEVPGFVRRAFEDFEKACGTETNRRVFTYGQLDPDKMIVLCRAGVCKWWTAFTGRTYFGDLESMKKLRDAFEADSGAGEKPGFSGAMSWVTSPHTLTEGFSAKIDKNVIRQLLEWGADPNWSDGKWLLEALKTLDADSIRPFLEHGAAATTVSRALGELQAAKNYSQIDKVMSAAKGRVFHAKIDDDLLLEAKCISDSAGGSLFKTLFNFRARRVNEIYDSGCERPAAMNSISFDEYDAAALEAAHNKLRELGGKPRDPEERLGKTKKPVLASAPSP
jgi:hypothetical protein